MVLADAFPWLVADIGGTNARFGLVTDASLQVQHVRQLRGADHAGPADAARAYLAEHGAGLAAPRLAAFAVATAITGDRVELTNSPWSFSRQAVTADLALDALLVFNDFEALALSLPTLTPAQVRAHGDAPALASPSASPRATLAVIGPGTGLGVAGMVSTPWGWQALPGEGGHVTVPACDDFESALLTVVRRQFEHVSAERLLSGIGLPTLHQAVAQVMGVPATALDTAQISDRAVAASDAVCVRTVDVFCALLGTVAGNLALTLGSRGGVYIGGGIVPRWGDLFFQSRFRERFEAKGRFRSYLQAIPTALIVDTQVALGGAAVGIQRHLTLPA